ncbi:MAG: type II/IV secretion system protein, partial [Bdellovibrionales bacterium]|nr:type II/IV secretion system protein [Bdellovibrionales bacterium]
PITLLTAFLPDKERSMQDSGMQPSNGSNESGAPLTPNSRTDRAAELTGNLPPVGVRTGSKRGAVKEGPGPNATALEKLAFEIEKDLPGGARVYAFDGSQRPFVNIGHIVETIQDGGEIPDELRAKLKLFTREHMIPLLIRKDAEVLHPESGKRVKRDQIVIALRGTNAFGTPIQSPVQYSLPLADTIFPAVAYSMKHLKPYRFEFLAVNGPTFEQLQKLIQDKELRLQTLQRLDPEASAKEALGQFFRTGVSTNASDIHIQPTKSGSYEIRFRVNGVMRSVFPLPHDTSIKAIAQIKNRSKMKLEEKRRPQDGRLDFDPEEIKSEPALSKMSARVSIIPTTEGEKVVMRLLQDASQNDFQLEKLGLKPQVYQGIQRLIKNPHGIILVTGPTGSGKTRTLYSILEQLNDGERNICTAEDPVEVSLNGIAQVQVHKAIDLDFPVILRSFLRQDPDIILVGEIRDEETAEIAAQAALTGHLVFATVHANDSFGTVQRLRSLGVDNSKIQNTLKGVLSQRLVRSLCDDCKEEYDAMDELNRELGPNADGTPAFDKPVPLFRAKKTDERGAECECCQGTGYTGRFPVTELWVPTPAERDLLIKPDIKLEELYSMATGRGMLSMLSHAIEDIRAGKTSFQECLARAFSADELRNRRDEIIPLLRVK